MSRVSPAQPRLPQFSIIDRLFLMKLNNLAIASALLSTGVAHAQSSVTLYGLLDTSLVYVNNAKSATSGQNANQFLENSGSLNTSRWGLRGTEDLGGGLSAVFDVENGFMGNNGTFKNGGDLFGRQAWVGLHSNQYGTVTLGRQYDFIVDYVALTSATGAGWGGNLAAHPYDNDNLDNDMRLNNAVKFSSASYGGFKAGAMYAFSGQAGGAGNNDAYSLGASYGHGPFTVAAAYIQVNRSTAMVNTTGAVSTGDADYLTEGGDQRIYGVGARYQFGDKSTIGVVYTHSVTYNVTGLGLASGPVTGSSLKFDNFEINGRYFVRSDLSLGLAYTYTMGALAGAGSKSADPHWNQFVAQADYSLSTRTDVYIETVYQRTGNTKGNPVFNAQDINMAPSAGNSQVVAAFGMRHRF
jgi:GBP family porin